MAKRKTFPEVERLARKIERWRQTRTRRGRMPEGLWDEAVGLALRHGLYPMSQALRLRYDSLKFRLSASDHPGGTGAQEKILTGGFVQVVAPTHEAQAPTGVVIELGNGGGPKMVVRLPAGAAVDLAGLASSLRGRT